MNFGVINRDLVNIIDGALINRTLINIRPVINEDLSELFISHWSWFLAFVIFAGESLIRVSDGVIDQRSVSLGVLTQGDLDRCKVCWGKWAAVLWVRATSCWFLRMESCIKPEM